MASVPDHDGLSLLAQGFDLYLSELDRYRALCLQHESSTVISAWGPQPLVRRKFEVRASTLSFVCSRVEQFPPWQRTPHFGVEQKRWEHLRRGLLARSASDPGSRPLLCRGIAWEDRAFLVHAFACGSTPVLHVGLLPLPTPSDLPELPLRAVADTLRCHEALLPNLAALDNDAPDAAGDWLTIRHHLARATPQNLYASQCFGSAGAG
jgi:hypothetical protein